ncbi:DUF3592 domain-containing protein [Emticicia sp. C21]|uniref:DUF3592 domain-containing protein n=1 Tax=Emticicia sp. C21 TaxID=2302915 RepID=UPI000E351CCD|nr:DUF3592 domain-containing protein [Emticicia sp. C21]RFS18528.1 DUF3592 domain-containing protein [Emticicia sp. C21]
MITVLFALVFLIIALFSCYSTIKSYSKFRKLSQHGLKAKGVIKKFDIEKGEGDDDNDLYFPIVQFRTYLGFDIQGRPMKGYQENEYQDLPTEVEVIYLDSDPEEFIIEGQKFNNTRLLIIPVFLLVCYEAFTILSDENTDWLNEVMEFFKSL